jgi:transposase
MHLSPDEIGRRYRTCPDAREKTRWHAVWLLARPDGPLTVPQAAALAGYSAVWLRKLLRRWNDHGPAGLADRRRANGAAPLLSDEQRCALYEALHGRPDDGGLWTGPKLARYVADRWGVKVCHQTGWRWLRELGFSLQLPRPANPRAATPEEQRRWL